ncbi:MAG: hypothetical protein EXS08_16665 [Planctomycetes bacterium]|nr:hypothetical protein [Planctomycetota bacterium]
MLRSSLLLSLAVLPLVACASSSELRVVEAATPAQTALLFDQVKALEGNWEMTDEQGQGQVASVFALSSNGSVVREIMFPGTPSEMTNVYHMDGPTLVMTHYCAEGNQPRMRACTAEQGTIAFRFDSVTNLTEPHAEYMGELTLVRVDADTLRAEWKSMQDGKVVPDHSPVFTLTRKK